MREALPYADIGDVGASDARGTVAPGCVKVEHIAGRGFYLVVPDGAPNGIGGRVCELGGRRDGGHRRCNEGNSDANSLPTYADQATSRYEQQSDNRQKVSPSDA